MLTAALATAQLAGQRRGGAGGPNDATVPVQIALTVGEQPFRFGGEAVCQHAPAASIYGAPAELWLARHTEAARSLHLSFWRVKGQGDMFTLALSASGASHRASTVHVGTNGDPVGSGRATYTASGNGGTFTLNVVADDGTKISGSISCGRFAPVVAEGGD